MIVTVHLATFLVEKNKLLWVIRIVYLLVRYGRKQHHGQVDGSKH